MQNWYRITLFLTIISALGACGPGADRDAWRNANAKAMTTFSLNGVAGTVNETNKTIAVSLPYTSVVALAATFTTTGSSVTVGSTAQVSGTTVNNFNSPVVYTVTAVDGTTANYTVTVTVALNPAKAITAFTLSGATGNINETNKTIGVSVPYGSSVTALVATFTTTGSSVAIGSTAQVSGTTPNNFTSSKSYTVTAADATTVDYTVTVTIAPALACIWDTSTWNNCNWAL